MIVLASASTHRAKIVRDAGIEVLVDPATVNERTAEAPLLEAELPPDDIATVLAELKALDVSPRHPGAIVLGGDQVLSLDGEILHKVANMEEARRRLLRLSGRTHQLHSALSIAKDGEIVWRHIDIAEMTMRDLDPGFVGRHLASVGEAVLSSVGAYQIEGPGVQLFKKWHGDLFTIIGMPLLPLLAELRRLDVLDG